MIKNISDSCPNVYIENIQIKQVHECKTLGVTIDQHLSTLVPRVFFGKDPGIVWSRDSTKIFFPWGGM
jgi:hypothetical protein